MGLWSDLVRPQQSHKAGKPHDSTPKTNRELPTRNFDFTLLDPVPDADYDSMVIGPKAARVKYVRRTLAPASA
jgi:hypothetical protein